MSTPSYVHGASPVPLLGETIGQNLRRTVERCGDAEALVVKSDITSVDQLKGKTIATPQLGNTQDVALRYWLTKKGLHTSTTGGGGDVFLGGTNDVRLLEGGGALECATPSNGCIPSRRVLD